MGIHLEKLDDREGGKDKEDVHDQDEGGEEGFKEQCKHEFG